MRRRRPDASDKERARRALLVVGFGIGFFVFALIGLLTPVPGAAHSGGPPGKAPA